MNAREGEKVFGGAFWGRTCTFMSANFVTHFVELFPVDSQTGVSTRT